jgi:hypothetical protein
MLTSITMTYAGFEGNVINWAAKWLSLIIGVIIVYSFAASRYNVPTFAKTSIGPIGQLSPKLLAPDSRYQKGFLIYLSLLLLLYFAFCIIGPKVLDIPGISIPENWKDSTLWPVGAASALVTVGLAADSRFPGNIENFFRRKAHEAAYIPTAFATLSNQLASFRLAEWWGTAKDDPDTSYSIRAMSGAQNNDSVFRAVQLREGNMVSWIRGNVLLNCLDQLSGEQYGPIKGQDENRDAAKLLAVLHESIKNRLGGVWTDPSTVKIDAALAKDIESFIDGASVLLASTLLQATPDARDLSAAIKEFGFAEIDSTNPQPWMQFATLGVGLLCAATFMAWMAAFLLSELPWIEAIQNYSARINQTAASTAIVYSVSFVVLMYARERRIARKQWDERLGSQVDIILWGGVPAALIATGAILFLPYVENLQGVLFILTFNLAVALIASVFFVIHMRGAARTKEGLTSFTRRLIGAGTWMHACAALAVAVILTFVTMKLNYEYSPGWSMAATKAQFNAVTDNLKRAKILAKGDTAADKAAGAAGADPVAPNTSSAEAKKGKSPYDNLEGEFRDLSNKLQQYVDDPKQARNVGAVDGKPGKTDNGTSAAKDVVDKIVSTCKSLRAWSNGLNQNLFESGGDDDPSCKPIEANVQDSSVFAKAIAGFGKSLETLRGDVEALRDYSASKRAVWEQMAIAGMFALFVSLSFSVVVRFGRIAQLRNDIDMFDDETIADLKQKADHYFKGTSKPVDIESWLCEPNQSIGLMTPLEGVRYRGYRASLFDSFRPKSIETRAKGTSPPATPVDGHVNEQGALSTQDESHATTVAAPPTVPDSCSAAAGSEAEVVDFKHQSDARRSGAASDCAA